MIEWKSYVVPIEVRLRPETTPLLLAIARAEGEMEQRLADDLYGKRILDAYGRRAA